MFKYDAEKNAKLLSERGIGFHEIICAIEDGQLLDIKIHPNQDLYPNQKIMYVRILLEVYAVPYVEDEKGNIFLKTVFPSRKARKAFLNIPDSE